MNLRETILAADDIKREPVTVPEWGGITLYVKPMDSIERQLWADVAFDDEGKPAEHFRERLIVHTLVDEQGTKVFGDDDVPSLAKKNGRVVLRLFRLSQALNLLQEAA